MKYNFDKTYNRLNTNSLKWDYVEVLYGEKDLLPAWVADMDFQAPEPVIKKLKNIAQNGIYGYSVCMDSYYESVINWMKDIHNWTIKKEWILRTGGVVPSLNLIVQAYSNAGDSIIIQKPVYYPFSESIKNHERVLINNPLVVDDDRYKIDFDDFEKKIIESKAKLFILCSPHNPVGRVWTIDELKTLGEICIKNNVIVVSDEIHQDLTFDNHKHIPFASISPEFSNNCITCTSPSKTFNLAGLQASNIIIENPELRQKFENTLKKIGYHDPNIFAIGAVEASYNNGRDWYFQLKEYLWQNYLYLKNYIEKNIPVIKVTPLEGTYLAWLNFNGLNISPGKLKSILTHDAKLALSHGYVFGDEGKGFIRINIATPRSILIKVLEKLGKTF